MIFMICQWVSRVLGLKTNKNHNVCYEVLPNETLKPSTKHKEHDTKTFDLKKRIQNT